MRSIAQRARAGAGAGAVRPRGRRPDARRRPPRTGASSSCRATTFTCRAEHLSSDDPRFVWDTNFGGELDFVDYGDGRADVRRELPGDPRRRVPRTSIRTRATTSSSGSASAARARRRGGRRLLSPVAPLSRPRQARRRWTGTCSAAGCERAVTAGRARVDARVRPARRHPEVVRRLHWELERRPCAATCRCGRASACSAPAALRVLGVDGTQDRGRPDRVSRRRRRAARRDGGGRGGVLFSPRAPRSIPIRCEFGDRPTLADVGFRLLEPLNAAAIISHMRFSASAPRGVSCAVAVAVVIVAGAAATRRSGRRSCSIRSRRCRTGCASSCPRITRRRSCTSRSGITSARRTSGRAAPASRISSST